MPRTSVEEGRLWSTHQVRREFVGVAVRDPDVKPRSGWVVLLLQYLACAMGGGHSLAAVVRNHQLQLDGPLRRGEAQLLGRERWPL